MKKLNLNIITKILILSGFLLFYLKIMLSREILLYVHPRIIPFIICGLILFVLIAVILAGNIFNNDKKRFKFRNYIIYILTLLFIICFNNTNTSPSTAAENNNSHNTASADNNSDLSENYIYGGKTESDGTGAIDTKQLDIEDNIIKVKANNFVVSLDEILNSPKEFEGQEIEITGFIFKDSELDANQFIIARYMMVCCAADMQVAGVVCQYSSTESYEPNTWVKLKGKISLSPIDESEPVIMIEEIQEDPKPDTSYVYPY